MPDTTDLPETEPVEPQDICEHCSDPVDDCECSQCELCDEWNDDCTCHVCVHCSERFRVTGRYRGRVRGCATCNYCGDCINNGEVIHFTCPGCQECRSEDDRSCEHCGEYECCASFSCREDDCYRCTECCACRASSDYIKSYSCRDYPNAKPAPRTVPANFLYLGVENETETDEDNELGHIAEKIYNKHENEILMKEDGSLDHGIELVTGRYSLEEHKKLWPELCKTAINAGLRAWKHSSTGMHVHMSRAFFTPLDIGKLLVFINSDNEDIRNSLRRLAGRSANHYCQIQKKKLTDYHKCEDRYEAVNLTNDKTIEIRIFKGTLNSDHVLANIEFCHAVAYWIKETSVQDIEKWYSLWSYAKKHKGLYSHFIKFMEPMCLDIADDKETVSNS